MVKHPIMNAAHLEKVKTAEPSEIQTMTLMTLSLHVVTDVAAIRQSNLTDVFSDNPMPKRRWRKS